MENLFHIHSEDMPIAPYRYLQAQNSMEHFGESSTQALFFTEFISRAIGQNQGAIPSNRNRMLILDPQLPSTVLTVHPSSSQTTAPELPFVKIGSIVITMPSVSIVPVLRLP